MATRRPRSSTTFIPMMPLSRGAHPTLHTNACSFNTTAVTAFPTASRRPPAPFTMTADSNEPSDDMIVHRKSARRADSIPFSVSVISPPPRHLGTFKLDPATHCGDIVEHDGQQFEVKVVKLRYKYQQGKYRVIGKSIQVKSLARKAIEIYLDKKFQQS